MAQALQATPQAVAASLPDVVCDLVILLSARHGPGRHLDKTLSRFGQYPAFKLGFGRACRRRGRGAEEAWEGYPGAVGARVVYLELP